MVDTKEAITPGYVTTVLCILVFYGFPMDDSGLDQSCCVYYGMSGECWYQLAAWWNNQVLLMGSCFLPA